MANETVRNVIIIGGAPAGYTAAIYLSRATLSPLLLAGEKAGGQLMWTTLVDNYPGFANGVQGPDLMQQMRDQAIKFGTEVKNEDVTKVDFSGQVKKVWVGETEYLAKTVIISLGASPRMTGAGEERLFGRGVSTCATCDAAFFKGKTVYVVGGGDSAMEDTLTLSMYTNKLTIIHRKDSFKASKIMQDRVLLTKKVPVLWNTELVEVIGETKLEKIKVEDNRTGETKELPAEGLFVAVGHMPNSDLFKGQLELDQMGYIVTNMTTSKPTNNQEVWLHGAPTQTSVPGVFASGDVVDLRYKQAITAAGFGCMAALDAEKFLTGALE